MQKTTLFAAITLVLTTNATQAVVLNFTNSTTDAIAGSDFNFSACGDIDFTAGAEYRMCDPTRRSLGGGSPLQKDTIRGTENWQFNSTGLMTAVVDTATTVGLSATVISYQSGGGLPPSGSQTGDLAIDQGAKFKGNLFAFLAPTLGSGAGNLYGEATYTATSETSFEIFFPVLEAQWAGVFFPLGSYDNDGDGVGDGVTFYGTTDGSAFTLWAEHTILVDDFTAPLSQNEDPSRAGFADWTTQWYYVGTIDGFVPPSNVPVPAAVWLFGSGLLGLAGVARRRKNS